MTSSGLATGTGAILARLQTIDPETVVVLGKAIPSASVDRLYKFDAQTIYGIGPETLPRSTDGGRRSPSRRSAPG